MDELTVSKAPASMNPDAMFAALDSVAESTPGSGLSRTATPVSFPPPAPPAKLSVLHPLESPTVDEAGDAPSPVEMRRPVQATAQQRNPLLVPLVVLLVIAFVQAVLLVWGSRSVALPRSSVGTVVVESTPAGSTIAINGKAMGKTPVTLTLDPGKYAMEVSNGSTTEHVVVTVQPGIATAERFHFAGSSVNAGLQVSSQPLGARVSVDGTARGVTPLTIPDLQPGLHTVLVEGASGSTRESVKLLAGTTASLAVTLSSVPSSATGGWLTVTAPIDIQLFENGNLLGSSQSERIMLPAGRHTIEAVNAPLGYRTTHTLQIGTGTVSRLGLEMPPAVLSINALPWAEVLVDGKSMGVTPLGNVSLPIGMHEIVFRHPQLGERRRTAVVTLSGPNRVTENLSQR